MIALLEPRCTVKTKAEIVRLVERAGAAQGHEKPAVTVG